VWLIDMRKKSPLLSNFPYGLKGNSYKLRLALALVELGCVMRGDDPVSPPRLATFLVVDQHKKTVKG
jgi:hypothetical protein